jgi:hypothetical protein
MLSQNTKSKPKKAKQNKKECRKTDAQLIYPDPGFFNLKKHRICSKCFKLTNILFA